MPTIYHFTQPIIVDQGRYDVLIQRRGWYASPTVPSPTEFQTPVQNPSYADVETLKTNVATNTSAITTIQTQQSNERSDRLTSGDENISRRVLISNMGMTSGVMWLAYFNVRRTQTVNSIRTVPGSAASGTTVAKVALFTVDGVTGALTRAGVSANDTALWSVANTPVVKAIGTPVPVTSGQRVAVGVLWTGTTPPQLKGTSTQSGTELSQPPRISAGINGQADIAASYVEGDLVVNGQYFYCALVP